MALGVIVAIGLYTLYCWSTWHNWFWADPGQLSVCGRDYNPRSPDEDAAELRADGFDLHRLYPIFRAPAVIGPEVYSNESRAQRAAPHQAGEPCTGALVVRDAPGRYRVYILSGGP